MFGYPLYLNLTILYTKIMKKTELRERAKLKRRSLDISGISAGICRNIRSLDLYKRVESVMLFYPVVGEVNLLSLLNDDKSFYLPRVNGLELEVCPYRSGDELVLSSLKIPEPVTSPVNKSVPDIIFAPALCVDKEFYRLGYGKGYYDRFALGLEDKLFAVVADELVVDKIDTDEFDVRCAGYITEKKASFYRG